MLGTLRATRISIHAPREGRDLEAKRNIADYFEFQSTRPARGATEVIGPMASPFIFQSTRPARGATSSRTCWVRAESLFQSTRPARGATCECTVKFLLKLISIHAPREGRDHGAACDFLTVELFQSTRPARGATAKVNKFLCTFLQKRHGFQIFLRKTLPFKAFCRLQIGKNFSICGANRCGNFCELLLRTIRSSVLPEGRSACSQNAQFYSHTFSRDNRNADCLFPDP